MWVLPLDVAGVRGDQEEQGGGHGAAQGGRLHPRTLHGGSQVRTFFTYNPAGAAGVGIKGGVGGGSVSSTSSPIGSHMAGPITMKLSGIDQGNSVSVLVRVRGGMIQDS